NDLAAASACM
ncbi:putative tail assembly protein, partial [Escherichia coli 6.0172]